MDDKERDMKYAQKQAEIAEALELLGHMNIGRNEECPCGSGKKFKRCHLTKKEQLERIAYAR